MSKRCNECRRHGFDAELDCDACRGYKPTPKKKKGRTADIADVMDERSKRNYVEYGMRDRRDVQAMIDEENRRY